LITKATKKVIIVDFVLKTPKVPKMGKIRSTALKLSLSDIMIISSNKYIGKRILGFPLTPSNK